MPRTPSQNVIPAVAVGSVLLALAAAAAVVVIGLRGDGTPDHSGPVELPAEVLGWEVVDFSSFDAEATAAGYRTVHDDLELAVAAYANKRRTQTIAVIAASDRLRESPLVLDAYGRVAAARVQHLGDAVCFVPVADAEAERCELYRDGLTVRSVQSPGTFRVTTEQLVALAEAVHRAAMDPG
ncbi:MAG: hypothetical protein GEU93_14300 [Propionibacteriales bacterium]|nr:hypothetical protein [Propionibacteriales bacterium]